MLKKLFWALLLCMASIHLAWADVDVNQADRAALDGVKGIGAVMSKKILDERAAHGPFRDWGDLQNRVKGIGDKNSIRLSAAGLRVNGQPKSASAAPVAADVPVTKGVNASVPPAAPLSPPAVPAPAKAASVPAKPLASASAKK